jgi:hypothetical protein
MKSRKSSPIYGTLTLFTHLTNVEEAEELVQDPPKPEKDLFP